MIKKVTAHQQKVRFFVHRVYIYIYIYVLIFIFEVIGKGVYRLNTMSGSPAKVFANGPDLKTFVDDGYASKATNERATATSPTTRKRRRQAALPDTWPEASAKKHTPEFAVLDTCEGDNMQFAQ